MASPEWKQRKWYRENNDRTCSYIQALFLYRPDYCHEMWFLNAEHTQAHLKNSLLRSVPTLSAYNAADVFAGHIFSSQNLCKIHLVSHFVLQTKHKRSNLFLPQKEMHPSSYEWSKRLDQKTKICILTDISVRKSLRVLVCLFLRVGDCH